MSQSALSPADLGSSARRSQARARRDAAVSARTRSFLRLANHELRTPLNAILGFSEMIQSEIFGPVGAPQYKEYAEIIHTSGLRLLNLVNQVLEIARLESRAADLDPRPESLDNALDDALAALGDEAGVSPVEVAGRGGLPAVIADPRGLRTILTNLLRNATEFSPQDAPVRVGAIRDGDIVLITVENDGAGVDPDDLPRLVLPFEQGENALTRQSEGAGLGLAICDLLCRAMGGRMQLRSRPDEGFCVVVELPGA